MRRLRIGSTVVSRDGFAGVRIATGRETLCIDVINVDGCSYLLYTHLHPRHFPGVEKIDIGKTVSPSVGPHRIGPGNTITLGGFTVKAVDAYNIGEGKEVVHPKGLGVGYIVKTNDITVYHMGDTDLIPEILDIDAKIDILFIPIGCKNVLCPEEALEVVKSLRPFIAIPIHYEDKSLLYTFRDIVQPYTQVVIM
ncbi:MAG: MBL fold metallo-hydrolase [Ignisphaera sp.]